MTSMEDKAVGGDRVIVLGSRAVPNLLTRMRDRSTPTKEFMQLSNRITRLLAEEAIACLPSQPKTVMTPTDEAYHGISVREDNICAVSVIRAGDALLQPILDCLPHALVGKVLIQRDHATAMPQYYYKKLPPSIADCHVIMCDPMLGTGGTAKMCLDVLIEAGVAQENIVYVNVIACPEGINFVLNAYPNIRIVTAEIDPALNAKKYLVPGIGDYGDRYYGTCLPPQAPKT